MCARKKWCSTHVATELSRALASSSLVLGKSKGVFDVLRKLARRCCARACPPTQICWESAAHASAILRDVHSGGMMRGARGVRRVPASSELARSLASWSFVHETSLRAKYVNMYMANIFNNYFFSKKKRSRNTNIFILKITKSHLPNKFSFLQFMFLLFLCKRQILL